MIDLPLLVILKIVWVCGVSHTYSDVLILESTERFPLVIKFWPAIVEIFPLENSLQGYSTLFARMTLKESLFFLRSHHTDIQTVSTSHTLVIIEQTIEIEVLFPP